jgi:two-component system cell cycle response regulator
MVVAAGATFGWFFVVGPLALRPLGSSGVVDIARAVVVLVLAYGALVLLGCIRDDRTRRPALLLALGLTIATAVEAGRAYDLVHHQVQSTWYIAALVLAYVLIGLAAVAIKRGEQSVPEEPSMVPGNPLRTRELPRVWRYLMPYTVAPPLVALLVYVAGTNASAHLAAGTYILGATFLELVFVREFVGYRELTSFATRTAHLESLAAVDPVTGLPNQRTLSTFLAREVERSDRYGRPCSVLFLDLDHFKALNDMYGHAVGDLALREFSAVVRSGLRVADTLGRWGGEEFVAVLPEADDEDAVAVAERIRSGVTGHRFQCASGVHLTCSIGVATYPGQANNARELIDLADRAMYAAKYLGRNRVELAGAENGPDAVMSQEDTAITGAIETLRELLRSRGHDVEEDRAVSSLAAAIAVSLGCEPSEASIIGTAALIRGVGSLAIPDSVLFRAGPLTDAEWRIVRSCPDLGAELVARVPVLRSLVPIVRSYRERWDGSGYPEGISGAAIPLGARIISVAEAYTAMTSPRPHRPACADSDALDEVARLAGTWFDPQVATALPEALAQARHGVA